MTTNQIGIFTLFTLQFSVLVYCSVQLFREARKFHYGIQKKLSQSKQLSYALIVLCLLFNLFRLLNNQFFFVAESLVLLEIIDAVCETLPTLLLFSLTTELSYFYYQLCISLEEDCETFSAKVQRMQKQILALNIVIYTSVVTLSAIYIKTGSAPVILAIFLTLIAAFVIGVSLFIKETIRLYQVANRMREQYQLQVGPRIGFFILALGFFACKVCAQSYLIYQSLESSGGLNELFLSNYKQNTGNGIAGIFYLVGEFGSLLSLILLIKRHTHGQSHTKSFTASTVIEDLEENMIEATNRPHDRYTESSVQFL